MKQQWQVEIRYTMIVDADTEEEALSIAGNKNFPEDWEYSDTEVCEYPWE